MAPVVFVPKTARLAKRAEDNGVLSPRRPAVHVSLPDIAALVSAMNRPVRRFLTIWFVAYAAMNVFAALFPDATAQKFGSDPIQTSGAYLIGVGFGTDFGTESSKFRPPGWPLVQPGVEPHFRPCRKLVSGMNTAGGKPLDTPTLGRGRGDGRQGPASEPEAVLLQATALQARNEPAISRSPRWRGAALSGLGFANSLTMPNMLWS